MKSYQVPESECQGEREIERGGARGREYKVLIEWKPKRGRE